MYSNAFNIPYVFLIKQQFFINLVSIKTEFNVVLLYNFKIIFYDKHFKITQVKHTTELISFETQCKDSISVDKVFKSRRFKKICFKQLFQNY